MPEIVHTKDGSAVVRELLIRGNARVSSCIHAQGQKLIGTGSETDPATLTETHFGYSERWRCAIGIVHSFGLR